MKPVTRQQLGLREETALNNWLRKQGFRSIKMPFHNPYDLFVDGARIEVKCCEMNSRSTWGVNFHRRGILDESRVDAYVIKLYGVPGHSHNGLHLVLRAPVGVMRIDFSFYTLLTKHHSAINNWELLRQICKEVSK
jgi:hypothetical protein